MNHKVLIVDDEPAVLEGYKRLLRREFDLETAEGGELGLRVIQEQRAIRPGHFRHAHAENGWGAVPLARERALP